MFWSFTHRIRVTLISAIVGGMAGGAAYAVVQTVSQTSSLLLLPLIAIFVAFFFGTFGASIGGLMGIVPTIVIGGLLSLLRRIPPFDHWGAWLLSGAAGGVTMALLTSHWAGIDSPNARPTPVVAELGWTAAWVVGGASAMFVYWKVETNWARRSRA